MIDPLRPLLDKGYRVTSTSVDNRHFGNAIVVLEKDDLRLKLVREKDQWLADIGTGSHHGEWFDLSIVLRAIGGPFPAPEMTRESVAGLVSYLADTASQWEPLFASERYADTSEQLRSIQEAWKRELLGYSPD